MEFLMPCIVVIGVPSAMLLTFLVFDELKQKHFGKTVKDLTSEVDYLVERLSDFSEERIALENKILGLKEKLAEYQQKIFTLSEDRNNLLEKMEEE